MWQGGIQTCGCKYAKTKRQGWALGGPLKTPKLAKKYETASRYLPFTPLYSTNTSQHRRKPTYLIQPHKS
jgi:hypothetical protein